MPYKWGNKRERARLREVVFKNRYDSNGNLVYEGDRCYLCGEKIDLSLPAGVDGAPEMDDVVPLSKGGDPLDPENLRPTHKRCNNRKNDRPVDIVIRKMMAEKPATSRHWDPR